MSIQTFTSEVLTKEYLTDDVILLSLKVPDNFTFSAGQYVMLTVQKGDETKQRAYSMLSSPSKKGTIKLCIKLIEGGFASSVFKVISVGQEFKVKGPLGNLLFDESAQEHWFIACGCGVVPFYSIIKEYLPKHQHKKFVLLSSVKTENDLVLHEEFEQLEKQCPAFTYVPTLTREEWEGKTGRVQKHLPDDLKNKTFYICGLKELVVDIKELLHTKGVDPKNIKTERYT